MPPPMISVSTLFKMCIRDSSYTVVPQALVRGSLHLNAMWLRRQTTKYNGVPYIDVYKRQG